MLDVKGDWAEERPDVRPGGWAFQYWNDYYPDLDDTAVVAMALHRFDAPRYAEAISRGREWVEGLQSKNGGWGAFDADNVYYYLNNIPFADHGALLDPPTDDVTGRCIGLLMQLGAGADDKHVKAGIEFLRKSQLEDGSWFGRWGVNYIYGTWSALAGLNAAGISASDPMIRRAADWLVSIQNAGRRLGRELRQLQARLQGLRARAVLRVADRMGTDGPDGGGRSRSSGRRARHPLSAGHAAGRTGSGREDTYTGGGFPRVFYLRYHGYAKFFPLWAVARYRNLKSGNSRASRARAVAHAIVIPGGYAAKAGVQVNAELHGRHERRDAMLSTLRSSSPSRCAMSAS